MAPPSRATQNTPPAGGRHRPAFDAFATLKTVITLYWRGINGHCDMLQVDFRNGRAYPEAFLKARGAFDPEAAGPRRIRGK